MKYLNNNTFSWNPATDDTVASAFCRPKSGTITLNMRNGENMVIGGNSVNGNFGIVGGGAGLAIGC